MANIKDKLNNIKNALFGHEVRASIHDGIEAINEEVENTTSRQNVLENTFEQLTINAGNSNAEIVAARVEADGTTHKKIGDRLNKVDSQIKEKANKAELEVERRRIDSFTSLPEGSTTGDAELIDARIGADGVVYDNLGNGIRSQIDKLNKDTKLLNDRMPYINTDNVDFASGTKKTFIIKENEPINFSTVNNAIATIYGRNRFDLKNATFSMSGYSSSYTLTKKDNGLLISTTITNTTSSHYAYFDYIAEFDGDLYLSCNAKLISGKIETVCMTALLNDAPVEKVYGEGLLYLVIPVTKGDTIRCCFYGHMSEGVNSTVAYKDIMISYNGLYEFTKYIDNKKNGDIVDITKTINLSDVIAGADYNPTPKLITFKGLLSDAFLLPSTNTEIVQDVVVSDDSIPIYAYNDLYYSTETGIAVGGNGNLLLRINSMNKTDTTEWLSNNPVSITYKIGENLISNKYIDNADLKQGNIIEYEAEQTATYYFSKSKKNKKLVCFGDSITGMFDGKADYPFMIQMDSDIETVNCGFAGCQYTDHNSDMYKPFCMNRIVDSIVANDYTYQEGSSKVDPSNANYSKMYEEHLTNLKNIDWNTVDYVSMFWGTNDWGVSAILKSIDDLNTENKQRTNVEDSIKYCIEKIVTKYPHLKVLVICPYWRRISTGKDSNKDANSNGVYLFEFSDFIEDTVRKNYNLPVINLYWNLGANSITDRYYTKDGTHPTEKTKHIIANKIIDCLNVY